MILSFFIGICVALLNAVFSWGQPITELPFGIDSFVSGAVAMFQQFATYFPPLHTLWFAFLWYIGFKIAIRVIALIPIVRNSVTHIN